MDSRSPITFIGDSPLHVAVRQGQVEDVREILIQQQVDVNILNSKQETPLHLACSKNHSPIVQLLVAFGADPYIKDSNNKDAYGGFEVDQLMNKLLYCHGLRLWIDGPIQADNENPLHTAVRLGRLDDIQRILEGKVVDINDTNANHETPLHLACALGHKHIVYLLIFNGADMYKKDIFNNAPIHRAVSKRHIDIMDYLITDCACNPNIKGYQGRALLHFACGVGNVKIVTTLIKKYGISPMATDAVNQTPLHIAASHGQEEVVRLLITNYKLIVDCRSNDKLSPLHLACYCGHVPVIKTLLLEYKADLNARDDTGGTPLQKVALGGSSVSVQLMITCFNRNPLSATDYNGNTALHITSWHGHEDLSRLLITKYNCPVDIKNNIKETPLHKACLYGHSSIVRMLISEFKADKHACNYQNNTPLCAAVLGGNISIVQMLITEFNCSPRIKGFEGRSLLHHASVKGHTKLAMILITDFKLDPLSVDDHGNTPLHIACLGGHEELARLLITKYNCPVDVKDKNKQTPLHLACSSGHSSMVRMLISEFKADATQRDNDNDTAVSKAALNGREDTVLVLITELGCNPQIKGFQGRSLLHHACQNRNTMTAAMLLQEFPTLIYSTDNAGNSPLHFSSRLGKAAHVRLFLFDYHSPAFLRNKAGRTAFDLAKHKSIKEIFEEYMSSEHKSIQEKYKELQVLSSTKYSGPQTITRVFVLGNSGSGKSTLVESLKRKGIIYSFFYVSEADVPLHTAGIVPSVDQSNANQLIYYYDFAGDRVYYSSHAAILEMVSHSTVGTSVFLLVVNLTKGIMAVCDEIGYWLSFISHHGKALDSQQSSRLKVIIVLSHVDHLSEVDAPKALASIRQYLDALKNQEFNISIINIVSSDCRYPRSSIVIGNILQDIAKNIPPSILSFKMTLLHGMLLKDFGNVIACKFQDLLSHIKDTGICLPTSAGALYPIVKELHDIGLLMMIGRDKDPIENHLLLMNVPSLTNEVHQILFSESAKESLTSGAGSKYAKMGLFPENFISSRLPDHITKECLVQLQYCQEIRHADVGLDYSVIQTAEVSEVLLYFPALCQLETEHASWPHDPNLDFSIGWFAKCVGKLNYFPPRYLHVLLLRLTFMFALPASTTPISDLDLGIDLQDENCHCTMWKKGIHWLMREGVECIVKLVNENKGVVVIVKSRKQHIYQCIHMLTQIVDVVTEAKTEFCNSVSLQYYILNSNDPSSYSNEDKLYDVNLIKSAIENKDAVVRSASGHQTLTLESLKFIKHHTCWGFYFSMKASTVLEYIEDVVMEWEALGLALQLPYNVIEEIRTDEDDMESKRKELIRRWMNSPELCGPACWWLLVKALEADTVKMNALAARVRGELGCIIALQEKLLEPQYSSQKPDDGFLQSFAENVGNRWPSLASLLSLSPDDIEQIKRDKERVPQAKQALHMLRKWNSRENAMYGQLLESLKTVPLFRCHIIH